MFSRTVVFGAGALALAAALFELTATVLAQSSGQSLPPVTVDAPREQPKRASQKPKGQSASSRRAVRPARLQHPPVQAADLVSARAAPGGGTSPAKQKYQLPQTSASLTAAEIQEKINIVDTEDAIKYLPSLFVRKRNNGDTQPVLATRTSGLGASARSLVYADDILLSALIANNNSIGAPRWGLVAPEEISRIDFLYGPFSAAYPGNSAGGVLLITTRMPDKLEVTAKQTEAFQMFDVYKTKNTFRTDQTSVSVGDKQDRFSYFLSGNFENSYSQPLTWVTNGTIPAGTTGAIPALNRVGANAPVVGAGGLLHTEMATIKGKFAYDITPWVKATYAIGYWSNDGASNVQSYLQNAGGSPTFGNVAGFASNFYTIGEKHLTNSVSLVSDTKGAFDFDISASRYDYLQDIQRNPFSVIANSAAFTTYGKIQRLDGTNWMNGDAKGIWRPNDVHEVSFGLHGDRYYLNNPTYKTPDWQSGPDSTNTLYTLGQGTTKTGAIWVQDAWRFAPLFKLTLGGRAESWTASDGYNLQTTTNNTVGSAANGNITATTTQTQPVLNAVRFSPKASLEFEPSKQWLFTASFGQAYRFPTVAELYQAISAADGSLAIPNPNLRPENVLSEEISVERRFVEGSVRLSVFNENVRDALISQLTALNDGTGRTGSFTTNVDAVRNTGVEVAAQKNNVLVAGLETFGSVTYVDSRILSDPTFVSTTGTTAVGKHVPNIPMWRATAGVTYRPDAFWALTTAMRYSGKQYSTLDNSDVVPHVYQAFDGFTVVDLRAQRKLSDTATVSFGIDNVGDTKYTLFHPFPGRTYVTDIRLKF
jgi:iron complex outermembrane receptor protein